MLISEYTETCQPLYGPGFQEGGDGQEQDCQTIPVNNCRSIDQIDRLIVRQINKQGGEGVQDCHIYRQLDRQFVMYIYVDWDISHRKIKRNALGLKEAKLITRSCDSQIKVMLLQGQLSAIVRALGPTIKIWVYVYLICTLLSNIPWCINQRYILILFKNFI